jgi:branched-chain amino acid transport system substrate-binding protein
LLILDTIINKGNTTVVVTALSWISNGLAQKIHDNNMLQISVASAVFNYANLKSCVRFTGDISIEGSYLIEQLKKYNKIAVMYFNNDYGNGWFSTINSAMNNKIVASEKYSDVQTDFTAELQRIKSHNPEVIVLISTKEAAIIVKQAREIGITAQMLGTRPTLTNQLLAEPSAEGVLVTYPNLNDSLPIYSEFKNTYGYKMSSFGAEGYDLIISLDQVYQNENKDRNVLFNNFKNKSYSGALGAIKFSSEGQAEYDFTFMIVKNGSFEKLVK